MTFGQKFKQLRLEKGLKQQELIDDFSQMYGHTLTKSSISQYENDKRKPEIYVLKSFALYFNVSVDYLLGICTEKNGVNPKKEDDLKKGLLNYVDNYFKDNDISRDEKDEFFKECSRLYFDALT